MKFILSILFIVIFSISGIAQQLIGIPFIIKKGETQKVGRLQINYLGSLTERVYSFGANGERFEKEYLSYQFKVTDKGKTQEFKEVYSFKSNDLVIEIIEQIKDSDSLKITVMTEKQFSEKVLRKVENQMSFDELSKIKTFAIGPTGYAAVTSHGEKLLLKILESESAKSNFIWMLETGTDEAKLYALYGLRKLNKNESESYFAKYRHHSAEVQTMSGCEIGKEKFSDVLAQIEKMNN